MRLMLNKINKAIQDPSLMVNLIIHYLKGYYYKAIYKLFRKRVSIGKNFRVSGKLIIKGPGLVEIGDNVKISLSVTPWTYKKDATIKIGNNVFLNGTRFGCANNIVIEDDCILADCRILDTDFHGVHPLYRHISKSAPIYIRKNVWITPACFILKGVDIGTGTTITPNSVVTTDVPANCVFGGNPAVLRHEIILPEEHTHLYL